MWHRHLTLALALAGTVAYKPRTRKGRTDKDVERREASSASFDQMHDDYCAATDKDVSPVCADWAKRKNMEHRGKAPKPHKDEVKAMHEKFCGDPKNAAASQCARRARAAETKQLPGWKESRGKERNRRLQRERHKEATGRRWRGALQPDL